MIIKKPFLIITIALFFLNGCGFKVLEPSNVYISKFDVSGDKILADKIKNGVKTFFSDKTKKNYVLEFNIKKVKSAAEKDNNTVTKYNLKLSTNVTIFLKGSEKKQKFKIDVSDQYVVAETHYKSLKIERKIFDRLTNETIEKIIKRINLI